MLTDLKVKNAKPGTHADGGGLYLLVKPTGSKSWVFRYQANGKRRLMGLGSVVDVSLKQARTKAVAAKAQFQAGIDAIAARKAPVLADVTFKTLALDYVADNKDAWKNPKHIQQWENTLATYAFPKIGRLPPADITVDHVLSVLKPIWKEKTETASRLRGRVEKILDAAKVKGLRAGENPAAWKGNLEHVLPHPDKIAPVTHHPALPYAEIPEFMELLSGSEGTGTLCLIWAILAASRSGEARLAKWEEIQGDVWVIPAERMKMKREHRVPITPTMREILTLAEDFKTNEWIFPSVRKGVALSDMALTSILRRLRPGITAHGFRSTFRDWAAETTEYANEVLEMCLAHAVASSVEKAYRRGDLLDRRREVMDAWGKYCFNDLVCT